MIDTESDEIKYNSLSTRYGIYYVQNDIMHQYFETLENPIYFNKTNDNPRGFVCRFGVFNGHLILVEFYGNISSSSNNISLGNLELKNYSESNYYIHNALNESGFKKVNIDNRFNVCINDIFPRNLVIKRSLTCDNYPIIDSVFADWFNGSLEFKSKKETIKIKFTNGVEDGHRERSIFKLNRDKERSDRIFIYVLVFLVFLSFFAAMNL